MGDTRWKKGEFGSTFLRPTSSSYHSLFEKVDHSILPCYLIFPASPKGTLNAVHLSSGIAAMLSLHPHRMTGQGTKSWYALTLSRTHTHMYVHVLCRTGQSGRAVADVIWSLSASCASKSERPFQPQWRFSNFSVQLLSSQQQAARNRKCLCIVIVLQDNIHAKWKNGCDEMNRKRAGMNDVEHATEARWEIRSPQLHAWDPSHPEVLGLQVQYSKNGAGIRRSKVKEKISIAICGMEKKEAGRSESVINYAPLGLNASNPAIQRPSWSLESRCYNPECQLPGAVGFVNGYRQRSQKMLCDGGEKHGKVLLQAICDTQTTHQTTDCFALNAPHCGFLSVHHSLTSTRISGPILLEVHLDTKTHKHYITRIASSHPISYSVPFWFRIDSEEHCVYRSLVLLHARYRQGGFLRLDLHRIHLTVEAVIKAEWMFSLPFNPGGQDIRCAFRLELSRIR